MSVSLDSDDYQALRTLARQNDVSAAWLVRNAISSFLKSRRHELHGALATSSTLPQEQRER